MALSYPHKTTVITFLVCGLAVAGMATYVMGEKRAHSGNYRANVVASADILPTDSIVSNTDWQKDFPKISNTTVKPSPTSTGNVEEETLTDQFGKSFFTQFMNLQQNGQTNNGQAVQSTVDQAISDLAFTADQPTTYDLVDIKTSSKNDEASIRAYANTIGSLFYSHAPRADAIAIATEALEKSDMKIFGQLDPVITSYSTLVKNYLTISPPSELAPYHVDLINGMSAMLFVTEGLKKVSSDPVQGLVALSVYGGAQDTMRQSFLNMQDYLDSHDITFFETEGGRIFSTIR